MSTLNAFALCLCLAAAPVCTLAAEYTAGALNTLGGPASWCTDINARGVIVGSVSVDLSHEHAFVYSGTNMIDIGARYGPGRSVATAISDDGQVVGFFAPKIPTSDHQVHAFLYFRDSFTDIGTLGGTFSVARAISGAGSVVGASSTRSSNALHAFLYDNGTMKDLGVLPGATNSDAFGISDAGQVVGASSHAFLYVNGTMKDLGTLAKTPNQRGIPSQANAINRFGQIVGSSFLSSGPNAASHAFLYDAGAMRDLGTLGGTTSQASAINSRGEIVGSSTITPLPHPSDADNRAFVFANGRMRDLNSLTEGLPPKARLIQATGINDTGSIVALAMDNNNIRQAYLLTPKLTH